MAGDIRYALRTLAKEPSFTVAAVATLTLGIAVNTIVFSLLNSLALRPMPVHDADRVVRVYPVDASGRRGNLFSSPDFDDYRRGPVPFDTLAAYIPSDLTAGRSSLDRTVAPPRAALGYVVSPGYFEITGVRPALGRLLQEADELSQARVVVLNSGFWRARFAGDPAVVGASVVLNGEPFTIVGVASPEFHGTEPLVADLWVPRSALPIADTAAPPIADRSAQTFLVIGRLSAGVTATSAASALDVVARRLATEYRGAGRPVAVQVTRGAFFTLDPGLAPVIAAAMTAVSLVLLIACANVANLFLARAASRQREIAVRLAIGAGRWRILRQLTVEALILTLTAGVAAILLAEWTLRVLYAAGRSLAPFSWTVALNLEPDGRVFGYTLALAALAGLTLGLVPAFQASSTDVVRALNGGGLVSRGGARASRLRHALVVLEVAGSLILLMAAGLLLRGLQSAQALDLGFSAPGVVYADYDLKIPGYPVARARAFNDALVDRTARIPGVGSVALTSHVPLHGGVRRVTLRLLDAPSVSTTGAIVSTVSPDYFAAIGTPIVSGRTFLPHESAPAAMIGEGLARRFWPGQPALGRMLVADRSEEPRTIVGVVRDAANAAIWRDKEMSVYLPIDESTDPRDVRLLARTSGDTPALARTLKAEAALIDPNLRFEPAPLDALLRLWMLPSRVAAAGAGILAALAIAMASIGIYGVLSFTVSQRMREIGVRMALGADAAGVVRFVLRDGLRLVAAGLAIGGLCSLVTAPLLGRLLFGVSAFDPVTLCVVPLALTAVSLVACYIPARRASRLEPLVVLRVD